LSRNNAAMMSKNIEWILRIGLAFAFLYAALNSIVDPNYWLVYIPSWAYGYVPDIVLLHALSAVEIVIALWLLSGWKIFWPSVLALLMLLSIVVFDFSDFQVVFRDLAIASIALALAVAQYPRRSA
jgi:uncharacterized membrane protein YphA (DoxX/SURF4 family)